MRPPMEPKRYWLLLRASTGRPKLRLRPSLRGQTIDLVKRILDNGGIVVGWTAFVWDAYKSYSDCDADLSSTALHASLSGWDVNLWFAARTAKEHNAKLVA